MSLTRIPIYPNAEAFIKLKKQYIYEKQQQQEEEEAAAARSNFRGQVKEKKQKYSSHIPYLEEVWNELSGLEGVSMVVNKEGLTNYGQDLSTACEKNFGNVVNSYCIYMIRKEFPDLKMPLIKYIVYNHVLEILFSTPSSTLPENIGSSVDKQTQDKIRNFLNPLILEIKDRLPPAPITKETLNNAPFNIMPVFRHILSKYESIIDANQQITPVVQLTVASQQQPNLLQQAEGSNQPRQRPKKKKKVLKNENPRERNNKDRQFQPPRLFSLFPNPSLKWRFIKIDSQNLQGIFGRRTHQQQEETPFDLTQRSFFECFDFKKLKIKSERVEQLFRTCTVDPNRKDVFTSYHGANDIRRLSSSEYHNMNGVVNRQKLEQERKKRDNIEHIETRIPSPKTTNAENYKKHIMYMLQHFGTLVNFYDFQTARIRWSNYIGNRKATDHAINILLNGSTKYNKSRRKKTRRNKRLTKKGLKKETEKRCQ
ncbi:hypothetical protein RO3G_14761 [Rhizopus delemar RA 99-880]|uniref:Uncharacterized protein n=1 Tax=Rhizopus delemar (strain RA 99-880 / ATCC MYA-4621 / FGSC 9543 / NRRL 43880) TaxID=246409 RepID=I1CNM0_RHIO9|nr:hypothetical protein RO3G_14761 [Rhizopus delemar RA 99-880]|eukprot:EIE90050.1 hypothetical protein RO3G_14761 [Rhizopus delemar RA 99-880]